MKIYKHIFFDLDHTLWDFDKNSTETLLELYNNYNLAGLGVKTFESFHAAYKDRNEMMWDEYRLGKIDKATLRDKRFTFTFWDLGLDPETAPKGLSEDYIRMSPARKHLFPHSHEVLTYLKEKYKLHIITNGFEEAQHIKLEASDLKKYFEEIIISEHTGFKKPDIRIFEYSAKLAKARPEECIMIGDGLEVDVLGALAAGWDAVFFNPHGTSHSEELKFEIASLDELKKIL